MEEEEEATLLTASQVPAQAALVPASQGTSQVPAQAAVEEEKEATLLTASQVPAQSLVEDEDEGDEQLSSKEVSRHILHRMG